MIKIPVTSPQAVYQAYEAELKAAVARVLSSGWYILGPEVEAFEKAFAAHFGLSHATGVANGTDAISVALRTLGIGSGDAVLTVSHTAVATVAAIELAGATPVLIDVDPIHYTIDPDKVERTLASLDPSVGKPRAIVAVHLYGNLCDLDALRAICARHELYLIEDCAQAHGAKYRGRYAGTMGDVATFSFYPTKNLGAFGDGGAVAFAADEFAQRAVALREYGWRERYISDLRGMNSRLDPLQAALLNVRLTHFDEELAQRRSAAGVYDARLPGIVKMPAVRDGCRHAYHLYVVQTPERDRLRDGLAARGIGTGIHYPQPIHLQPAYAGRIHLGAGGLGVTEALARNILSLPMHGFLSDDDAAEVAAAVAESLA